MSKTNINKQPILESYLMMIVVVEIKSLIALTTFQQFWRFLPSHPLFFLIRISFFAAI